MNLLKNTEGNTMSMLESIHKRRSYYQLIKELPVDAIKIKETVQQATELVPDAFNMKSARIVLTMNRKSTASKPELARCCTSMMKMS